MLREDNRVIHEDGLLVFRQMARMCLRGRKIFASSEINMKQPRRKSRGATPLTIPKADNNQSFLIAIDLQSSTCPFLQNSQRPILRRPCHQRQGRHKSNERIVCFNTQYVRNRGLSFSRCPCIRNSSRIQPSTDSECFCIGDMTYSCFHASFIWIEFIADAL